MGLEVDDSVYFRTNIYNELLKAETTKGRLFTFITGLPNIELKTHLGIKLYKPEDDLFLVESTESVDRLLGIYPRNEHNLSKAIRLLTEALEIYLFDYSGRNNDRLKEHLERLHLNLRPVLASSIRGVIGNVLSIMRDQLLMEEKVFRGTCSRRLTVNLKIRHVNNRLYVEIQVLCVVYLHVTYDLELLSEPLSKKVESIFKMCFD